METIKYVKADCGKHWGPVAGPCPKCAYQVKLQSDPKWRACFQHNGTPWIAVLGPEIPKPFWWK